LQTANALTSLNNNLARLIGPALGGMAFAALGFPIAVVLDVASFLIAAAMISVITAPASVTKPERETVDPDALAVESSLWHEWIEGLRIVRHNRVVSALFAVLGINQFAEGILSVLIIVWVQAALKGGSPELGWLLTAQAVGGLLGGLFIGRIAKRVSSRLLVGAGFLLVGVLDFAVFNTPILAVGMVLMALAGAPVVALNVGALTLFQTSVEDRFRGRVIGAFGTTSSLLLLAGMGVASLLGNPSNAVLFLSAVAVFDALAGVAALLLLRETRLSVVDDDLSMLPADEAVLASEPIERPSGTKVREGKYTHGPIAEQS